MRRVTLSYVLSGALGSASSNWLSLKRLLSYFCGQRQMHAGEQQVFKMFRKCFNLKEDTKSHFVFTEFQKKRV